MTANLIENDNEALISLINELKINSDDGVIQLFFGKKRREKSETKYNFYRASIGGDVKNFLIETLRNNLKKISKDNVVDEIDDESGDYYVKRDLADINNWKNFQYIVFSDFNKFQDKKED